MNSLCRIGHNELSLNENGTMMNTRELRELAAEGEIMMNFCELAAERDYAFAD